MDTDSNRLSQIQTSWTEVESAGSTRSEVATEARRCLLRRYATPVYQYLLACVADENAADDLAQEFAVRFMDGRLTSVHQDRGRFRDFLKRSARNLAMDHYRALTSEATRLQKIAAREVDFTESSQPFDETWRNEVLKRTWVAFEEQCHKSESTLHAILRYRADNPEHSSSEMANDLSTIFKCDETLTDAWVRQNLHRARKRFAKLLRAEVAQTVSSSDRQAIDDELAELGLLKYCDL